MNSKKLLTSRNMALMAILASLASILMAWDFSIPLVPPFYKLDFSEIPVMIGGFVIGPWASVIIEGLKVLIRMLIKPTSTAYVGELANFIVGVCFVFPASMYYQRIKTKKGALIGLIFGTINMTVVGAVFNYYILIPAYSFLYNMPLDKIIAMGTQVTPLIHDKFTFVLLATSPFNLFKGVVISGIVLLIYKHISRLLKKF